MDKIYFRDKNTLITGGLGFIGSTLAARLVALGASVTVVDNLDPRYGGNLWNIEPIKDHIEIHIADVRDDRLMGELVSGKDYVFNLAGQTSHVDSMEDPFTDLEVNARAQLTLLEACRSNNPTTKIIYTSTRQIYGAAQYFPVDEAHPIRPVDVNGIHKWAGEQYHLLYARVYNLRAAILRLTNTYGSGMRVKDARQMFLGIWLRNLIEGKPITVFGDGSQVRDFDYVDDVVDAIILAACDERAEGEIFNLGAKEKVSLAELAQLLVKIQGSGDIETHPFPNNRKAIDIGDYWADYTKIRSGLGWEPRTKLAEGLQKTLQYYRENITHYL